MLISEDLPTLEPPDDRDLGVLGRGAVPDLHAALQVAAGLHGRALGLLRGSPRERVVRVGEEQTVLVEIVDVVVLLLLLQIAIL
jgi:hypothetical protein